MPLYYRSPALAAVLAILLGWSAFIPNTQAQESLVVLITDSVDEGPVSGATVTADQGASGSTTEVSDEEGIANFSALAVASEAVPDLAFHVGSPYPNPSRGQVTIPVGFETAGTLRLILFDLLGRTLWATDAAVSAGYSNLDLRPGTLPPGYYVAQWAVDGQSIGSTSLLIDRSTQGAPSLGVRATTPVAFKQRLGGTEVTIRIETPHYEPVVMVVDAATVDTATAALERIYPETTTNSIGMEFVAIPPGEFRMGARDEDYGQYGSSGSRPVHRVTLTREFWLGRFEVTQGEYEAVTGENPSMQQGDPRLPLDRISWQGAVDYLNALSDLEGLERCYSDDWKALYADPYACDGYRLPTDAEWEYAARAGTTTINPFPTGEAHYNRHMWHADNAFLTTQPVGMLLPNRWGLFDTLGNVWEFAHDFYETQYYFASPTVDPAGPSDGWQRSRRGFHVSAYPPVDAVGIRSGTSPNSRGSHGDLGFRVARTRR